MDDGGSGFEVKEDCQEGTLFINSHILKICLKSQSGDENNTISFKYTIDYPKIELHPFDTKKFTVYYNDTDSKGASMGQAIDR